MPPPVEQEDRQKEAEALEKINVKRFTANPPSVSAFASTTLSWEVTFAADFPQDVALGIFLDGRAVPPVGRSTVAVSSTRTFSLEARGEHVRAHLRGIRVAVDDSACQTKLVIRADDIVNVITGELNRRFSGNGDFSLKAGGTSVSVGDRTIGIGVPLEIHVPNWFDADMSVDISLVKPTGRPVSVSTVSVDVRWNLLEHVASLGCTGAVQSGMEKLAQAFLTDIVNAELAPAVDDAFNAKIEEFLGGLQASDPQGRDWVPRLVTLSNAGLSVTGCPLPPP